MALEEQSAVRSTGKVNWFNDHKGYGFITPTEGGDELFVHQSSIVSEGFRSLTVGDSVEFAITQGTDGKTKAVDVTAPGRAPLKKEKNSRGNGGRRGGGCYECGEDGHIRRDCLNGREREAGGDGCYRCGEVGHLARDCRSSGEGGGCYNCGEAGHIRRDCHNVGEGGSAGAAKEVNCYKCGNIGHFARECSQKVASNGRSGGGDRSGVSCYTCGGIGHLQRECPSKRQPPACHSCGGVGHFARDCNTRGSSGKCFKCGKEGHIRNECSVA